MSWWTPLFAAMASAGVAVEPGTLQVASMNGASVFHIAVRPAALRRTPAWADPTADPPLSALKALILADAKRRALVKDSVVYRWELEAATIQPALGGDRWYYQVTYHAKNQVAVATTGHPPSLSLVVLMDGTVPEPVRWERARWMRAMAAGAFDPPKRAGAAPSASTKSWGEYWSEWGRRFRSFAIVYWEIATAPKLRYRIEALEVYQDGVWAEYTVLNPGPGTKYTDPWHLRPPVSSFRDARGREWEVPVRTRTVNLANPKTFFTLPPGRAIRFRSPLSSASRPLEPSRPAAGEAAPQRPPEVTYLVLGWSKAYTRLPENGPVRESVFAVGSGTAKVRWVDGPVPESFRGTVRLDGSDK